MLKCNAPLLRILKRGSGHLQHFQQHSDLAVHVVLLLASQEPHCMHAIHWQKDICPLKVLHVCSYLRSGYCTFHGRQGRLCGCPAAVLGSLGSWAVGVEDQRVQRCRDGAVLPQTEHVLALMEVLVIQHQQRLRMYPAAEQTQSTWGCNVYTDNPARCTLQDQAAFGLHTNPYLCVEIG